MPVPRRVLNESIQLELRKRVAALQAKSYDALAALPLSKTESCAIRDQEIAFTTLRNQRPDGQLLILVRSDKPIFFGLGSAGTTEGFWIRPDGMQREALFEEIADLFG